MRHSVIVWAFLLSFFAATAEAESAFLCCSGWPSTPAERFVHATAVFIGEVEGFEVETGDDGEPRGRVWKMDVTQVLRGPAKTRLEVGTGMSYRFDMNEKYLVYANSTEDRRLWSGACHGNSLLASAQDHLDLLPPPVFDATRSGPAAVTKSTDELLAVLETSDDSRLRVGAWVAVRGVELPPETLLAAAERSLEVGDDPEWLLAAQALGRVDWSTL